MKRFFGSVYYVQCYLVIQHYNIYYRFLFQSLPTLGGLPTTKLTLWRSICSSITASIAITASICSPISPNALPINPYLAFAHTLHVQGQGFISFWCTEIRLPSRERTLFFNTSTIFPLWHCIAFDLFQTLCQVNGCCFCAANDPCIHSTEDMAFGETRSMASPFSPTCLGEATVRKNYMNQN